MSERIQMVIVDDHPLLREGVAYTLRAEPNIDVVGEGETADDAIRLAHELLPDILLLDITMPGGGLNAVETIALACPVTKIVMLTVSEEEDDVLAALKAGAKAYILKGVAARELVSILCAVYAGEVWVTPKLAASLPAGGRHADPEGGSGLIRFRYKPSRSRCPSGAWTRSR